MASKQTDVDANGSHVVDKKTQRYDRQLRMWGGHGQQLLQAAHVCCLGSAATATEILKNLILPSMGRVTIVDDAKVSATDLGNNFFVRTNKVGQNRAQVVATHLSELNPYDAEYDMGSQVVAVTRNPVIVVRDDLKFFNSSTFDVVINTCIPEAEARTLAAHCYSNNIHFLNVRVNGLLGHIRLCTTEVTVTNDHAKATKDRSDLYLHPDQVAQWPEYKKWMDSFAEIKSMSAIDHKHLPYPVILYRLIRKWQDDHDGALPVDWSEKKAFGEEVKKAARDDFEENFNEARLAYHKACSPDTLAPSVQKVLNDAKAKNNPPNLFWVCAKAVSDWMANEGKGRIPTSNDIPDMASYTQAYISLKEVFAARAAQDLKQIAARAQTLCRQHNIQFHSAFATRFVQNVRYIGILRTTDYESEFKAPRTQYMNDAFNEYTDFDQKVRPLDIQWYIAFRAAEEFNRQNGRYPGTLDSARSADAEALAKIGNDVAASLELKKNGGQALDQRIFAEFVRYGYQEIHNQAAMMGGIVSQIVLKILINQFVTINNTAIVNGIHGSVKVLKL